jgi:hypothetical protein
MRGVKAVDTSPFYARIVDPYSETKRGFYNALQIKGVVFSTKTDAEEYFGLSPNQGDYLFDGVRTLEEMEEFVRNDGNV